MFMYIIVVCGRNKPKPYYPAEFIMETEQNSSEEIIPLNPSFYHIQTPFPHLLKPRVVMHQTKRKSSPSERSEALHFFTLLQLPGTSTATGYCWNHEKSTAFLSQRDELAVVVTVTASCNSAPCPSDPLELQGSSFRNGSLFFDLPRSFDVPGRP